ncbi:MAG: hypothetical protein ACE5J4_03590 [Candidatus Aenigmatarchaeota archaeon]
MNKIMAFLITLVFIIMAFLLVRGFITAQTIEPKISCSDFCLDNTLFYNGNIVDGECIYSTTECENECSNAMCK